MARQDAARTTADRLVQVERALRTQPGLLAGAAAVSIMAAGLHAWLGAPELVWVSFAAVATALDEVVGLVRQIAEAKAEALKCSAYEALIDQYEPGARIGQIEALFDDLVKFLPNSF